MNITNFRTGSYTVPNGTVYEIQDGPGPSWLEVALPGRPEFRSLSRSLRLEAIRATGTPEFRAARPRLWARILREHNA